uniref:Protein S-acyltransferase n=1 Tax=Moniliophthora roreri TaxID=221103 RepID=A0A0W0F1Y8_MONRR
MPLVSFTNLPSSPPKHLDLPVDSDSSPRKWYHHLMLLGTALLIFAPHPSLLYFLLIHYLKTLDSPIRFAFHLFVCYTLTFGAYTSLIVCVARDPGPTTSISENENENEGEDEMGLTEALLSGHHDDDFNSPAKWCRKCWAPKYERTHHCSMCGRCVLKMGKCLFLFGPPHFANPLPQTIIVRGWAHGVSATEHTPPSFTFSSASPF